jgi:hypothetical protein
MANDVEVIHSSFIWLISIYIAILVADNWIYVLFQSKLENYKLIDLYDYINDAISNKTVSTDNLNTVGSLAVLYDWFRFILIVPHWIFKLLLGSSEYIRSIFIPSTSDGNYIFSNMSQVGIYSILYPICIVYLKYMVDIMINYLKFITNPVEFIKNPYIVIGYIIASFMFIVSYYEPNNNTNDNDSSYTKFIKMILYFILTIPLSVPIGLITTIMYIALISIFGKNMCHIVDPDIDPVISSVFNNNVIFQQLKFTYILPIVSIIIGLFVVFNELRPLLSNTISLSGSINSLYTTLFIMFNLGISISVYLSMVVHKDHNVHV